MVSMDGESAHEPESANPDVDRIVRRLDARRSLPPVVDSPPQALGSPSAVIEEGQQAREAAAEVVVTPSRVYVTMELPGAAKETLEVTATATQVTVHARGPEGRTIHQEIDLPGPVDPDAVTATYRNGVLDVSLPRRKGCRNGGIEGH